MKSGVVFVVPTPPPAVPEAEAYAQEISALRGHFGGRLIYVNPNRFLPRALPLEIPRPLFGGLELPTLLRAGRRHDLYQLYSPTPYRYPFLALLPRPVVYNLTGCADPPTGAHRLDRVAAVTVADPDTAECLRTAGLRNVHLVRPGIDTARFSSRPRRLDQELHLLMASAPWTEEQFRTKGIDALLEAASRDRRLRITFLWRGVLTPQIRARVDRLGLGDRVEVVDRVVEVDDHLARVHATVVLAAAGDIVKSYPHSLMESLAAGKPVVASRAIAMARDVQRLGVGVVVDEVTVESLLHALEELRLDYAECSRRAHENRAREFDVRETIASFARVYAHVLERAADRPAHAS